MIKRELDCNLLPEPVFDDNQEFVEFYFYAWELAWNNVKSYDGVPVSPLMNEGFADDRIWIWATCLMSHFCNMLPTCSREIQPPFFKKNEPDNLFVDPGFVKRSCSYFNPGFEQNLKLRSDSPLNKRGVDLPAKLRVSKDYAGRQIGSGSSSTSVKKKTLILQGIRSSQIIQTLGLSNINVIDMSEYPELSADFDEVATELSEQRTGFNLRASQQTFGILLRLSHKAMAGNYPPNLANIMEFIYINVGHNITLKDIYKFAGISAGTLNKLFNQYIGISPIDFVLQHKIKVAKNMLLGQHSYIKEIAEELGYANQFYFTNDFKKCTGMPPSQFRKKNLDME